MCVCVLGISETQNQIELLPSLETNKKVTMELIKITECTLVRRSMCNRRTFQGDFSTSPPPPHLLCYPPSFTSDYVLLFPPSRPSKYVRNRPVSFTTEMDRRLDFEESIFRTGHEQIFLCVAPLKSSQWTSIPVSLTFDIFTFREQHNLV